jgi:hypothetical protein
VAQSIQVGDRQIKFRDADTLRPVWAGRDPGIFRFGRGRQMGGGIGKGMGQGMSQHLRRGHQRQPDCQGPNTQPSDDTGLAGGNEKSKGWVFR